MAYTVSQSELHAVVPAQVILEALDDDGDGAIDAGLWDSVCLDADRQINSRLAPRYATPVDPVPDLVIEAKKVFIAEAIYARRGVSAEANPWSDRAASMRKRLESIGAGKEELTAGKPSTRPAGALIEEPSRLYQGSGQNLL